jgi:hypothetical protein
MAIKNPPEMVMVTARSKQSGINLPTKAVSWQITRTRPSGCGLIFSRQMTVVSTLIR